MTIHGLRLLYQNLAILCQIFPWYLKIGAKCSRHRISPHQISHIPNCPPHPLVPNDEGAEACLSKKIVHDPGISYMYPAPPCASTALSKHGVVMPGVTTIVG